MPNPSATSNIPVDFSGFFILATFTLFNDFDKLILFVKQAVVRIQLVSEEEKMLKQRIMTLEGTESDIKDELKMELLVVEIKKQQVIKGVSKIINIMKQQDIDSTTYIALLIEETGNISQDFFSLKVLLTIG